MSATVQFRLDQEGRFLQCAPDALTFFGHVTEHELLGSLLMDLVHPDDRSLVQQTLASTANGTAQTAQGRLVPPQGERRRVEFQFVPNIVGEVEIRDLECTARPASTERSWRDVMTRLAAAVSAPIGDDFMNELIIQASDTLGLAGALIATVSTPDATAVETQSYVMNGELLESVCYDLVGTPCERVMRGETVVIADDVDKAFPDDAMLRDNGLRSYAGAPIHTRAGKRVGLLAVFDDEPFEDVKIYESSVRILAARVSSEMDRRTVQTQLRHSQKMESLGQLAGGMAHDFNNLLTVILSTVDLMSQSALDEREQIDADLAEIRAAAESAARLTGKLLSFSRRSARDVRIIEPNEVIESLMTMLGRLTSDNIEVSFEPETPVGNVRMDPNQLEQILLNLALNAADAMPDGGRLTIRTRDVYLDRSRADALLTPVEPGRYVAVSVADTGKGIPRDTLERIFEPFFTTKEQSRGTGLGLAMVYGIIEQSQAGIEVSTSPGSGTTFEMFFPLVDAQSEAIEERPSPQFDARTGTVLIVEDEDALRAALVRLFETAGYDVLTAPDGCQALEVFEEHAQDIDVLVSDLVMPKMDGVELRRRIREIRAALPIILMSGYSEATSDFDELVDEHVQLLDKPFGNATMLEAIAAALGRA